MHFKRKCSQADPLPALVNLCMCIEQYYEMLDSAFSCQMIRKCLPFVQYLKNLIRCKAGGNF